MSTHFSLFSGFQRSANVSALVKRRQRAFVRKIIVVLCAGIMSLLVISAIIDAQATQVIPVASRNIQQGSQLSEKDVSYIRVPQHSVFQYAFVERISSRNPLIATCEIKSGMPILQNAVSRVPNIPKGFTSIAVHLSSADQTIIPGDGVDLAFSKPVQDAADAEEAADAGGKPNGKSGDSLKNAGNARKTGGFAGKSSGDSYEESGESGEYGETGESEEADVPKIDKRYVDVVHHVIVMRISQGQQSSQDSQNTTVLAMPAADALRLIQAQSANPSLAIVAMKHASR